MPARKFELIHLFREVLKINDLQVLGVPQTNRSCYGPGFRTAFGDIFGKLRFTFGHLRNSGRVIFGLGPEMQSKDENLTQMTQKRLSGIKKERKTQ